MTIKPQRGGWSWWQASRVVQDRTLVGRAVEVIDEFPAFTFLLADIHPHMLSMPLVLLAIAHGLTAFIMGGWEGVSAWQVRHPGFGADHRAWGVDPGWN
jgi:uncharacterized membrane protein